MLRIFGSVFVASAAHLFDAHAAFRYICVCALPLLAACDMVSEIDFATQISCINAGLCLKEPSDDYIFFVWRDIVSCTINLITAMLAVWLLVLFGLCSNMVYMPRREHRRLTMDLDKQNIGWRKSTKAIGKD